MASGVKLSDGVKLAYDDIKKHSKYLYAIFIIKDGEIVVEKKVEKDKGTYDSFLKDLDVKDEGGDSVMRSKLFLLNWCPETSPIKFKMLYASSFDSLKRAFEGVK